MRKDIVQKGAWYRQRLNCHNEALSKALGEIEVRELLVAAEIQVLTQQIREKSNESPI